MFRAAFVALLSAVPLAAVPLAGCGENDDELLQPAAGPVDPLALELPAGNRAIGPSLPWLVQFDRPIGRSEREALERKGVRIHGYFPSRALLVDGSREALDAVRTSPGVRAVIEQPARWRVDPALRDAPDGALDLLVETEAIGPVSAEIERLGGAALTVESDWLLRARLRKDAIESLAARTDVRFVQPDPHFTLRNDTARFVVGGGDAPRPYVRGLKGEGQLVGVADSGVDTASCFFPEGKIAVYVGAPGDANGHGTHVAASIAGDRFGNGTVDPFDGIAPAAKLFVQDVGEGSGTSLEGIPRDLGRLFLPSYEAGARIHSDSWGTSENTYGSAARSLDRFVADHPDFLVLVANGNDGPDSKTVGSPATAKNQLAIGASGTGATSNSIASFSSRGPASDGRIKPTLVAPGVRIASAANGQECAVVERSGTSMATPIAAGAAALVRQYFTEGWYPGGQPDPASALEPSAALLRAVLIAGADRLAAPEAEAGFGRLDVDGALHFEGEGTRLFVADGEEALETGEAARYTLQLDQPGDLAVALAWTDRPGVSGAAKALVNDLDLRIYGPDGRVVLGNGRADRVDVEELVVFHDAAPGTYTVEIAGAQIPDGPQSFALAAVGPIAGHGSLGVSAATVLAEAPAPPEPPDTEKGGCASAGGGFGFLGLLFARRRAKAR